MRRQAAAGGGPQIVGLPQPERAPLGRRVGDDDLAVCGGVGAQAGLTVAVQHLHGHPLVRHHRDMAVEHDRPLKPNGELEQG